MRSNGAVIVVVVRDSTFRDTAVGECVVNAIKTVTVPPFAGKHALLTASFTVP